MRQTSKGRVTPEMLDELEKWATEKKKPHQLGIGSYTLKALVEEVREYRASKAEVEKENDYWGSVLRDRYWITPEGEKALEEYEGE